MAQTDARPGFRLPWSSDRQPTDSADAEQTTDQPARADAWPTEDAATPMAAAAVAMPIADPWTGPSAAAAPDPGAAAPQRPGKKPTKFMADLTKAMQAAAEDARSRALTQLQADAKTHVELIHGRSSTEAAGLRRGADDDVAAVREWSKAEIARIRDQTESRITERKARLETEIDAHAGVIEREIDAVQKTVAAYEDEMAAFFERLLGEEDPSRFATMAENLPEPPAFDDIVGGPAPVATDNDTAESVAGTADAVTGAGETEAPVGDDATTVGTADAALADADVEADLATGEADTATEASDAVTGTAEGGEGDREAAFAAIQAAAEAAASAEVAADAAARAEAVADVAIEIMGNHDDEGEADPRFAALGLSPDYDAAEAEALAAAGTSDEDIPEIGDEAVAARLAGLVQGKGVASDASATQIVVVGLVSVASIASFKRHLGRVAGVQSVGVSSGPDGEFVFAVTHGGDVILRDAIPGLPTFQARVTGSSDGVVHVTAHDPEADA
ncbi:MAG: hypothetical protein ABIZ72_06185 [Candidatus Limnocylindrales bacterium]